MSSPAEPPTATGAVAPPLDAECAAALATLPRRDRWSTAEQLIEVLRASAPLDGTDQEVTIDGTYEIAERRVHSFDEAEVSLLVCQPRTGTSARPLLYYVHGGGMCSGTARTGLAEQVQLASHFDAVVVSPEYRLAPEHPDPIPLEDSYAGLVATVELAHELDVDRSRIVVTGASAGGGLAAGIVLLCRDRGGPPLAGQMLMSPMLDDRNESFSGWQMAGIDVWDRAANAVGWTALLGDRCGGPDVSPFSAPGRATDLSGLPHTLLDVGTVETFRDEVVAYAQGIWADGGVAELHVWPGGFHGYEFTAPQSRLAQVAWGTRLGWLRRILVE